MPKRTALCAGINAYGNGADLQGCLSDSRDWSDALSARGFVVRQLLDGEATRDAMLAAITELVKSLRRGDTGVVTYSGHGSQVPDLSGDEGDRMDECLCPADVFAGNVITDDELAEIFQARAPGSRLVFVSDSCHSGTVARFAPQSLVGDSGRRARFLPPGDWLPKSVMDCLPRLFQARAGRLKSTALVMSGAADWEYSWDAQIDGRFRGAFTAAALDALATLPAGATYRDWHRAIRARLPSASFPQSPALTGTVAQKKWPVLA